MAENIRHSLAALIPVRPWIALGSLLTGVAISIGAFWLHDFWAAVLGLALMGGALVFLLIPLPHPR